MFLKSVPSVCAALFLAGGLPAFAQAPGVPVEPGMPLSNNPRIVQQAEALKDAGKLLSKEKVAELVEKPQAEPVELVPVRTQPMGGREVAALASKGFVRIGWFYLCPKCDHWHLNLAGGYVIDRKGAVATCHHCVRPDHEMREGYLIAVDAEEKVYAVTSVIAAEKDLDAAVLRIEGSSLEPLPLQDQVSPGDAAYLYSEPFGHLGYFSAGVVSRFYWKSGESGDPMKFEDAVRLRMNASTEWAPGSSGAALVDSCGNAIGHVSTISTLGNDSKKAGGPTMITLHEAVPARGIQLLLKRDRKETP
ncbi:MAG: serine protease [Luteolibacter sp.]